MSVVGGPPRKKKHKFQLQRTFLRSDYYQLLPTTIAFWLLQESILEKLVFVVEKDESFPWCNAVECFTLQIQTRHPMTKRVLRSHDFSLRDHENTPMTITSNDGNFTDGNQSFSDVRNMDELNQALDNSKVSLFVSRLAVFILEDALSVWTNLGKHQLLVWLFASSVKKSSNEHRDLFKDASLALYTVEPRLSGPRLSGLLDYPDFSSGPNLVMNIYQSRSRSVAISFLKLQH